MILVTSDPIPTAIAYGDYNKPAVIGINALSSKEVLDRIVNWKLHLGRTAHALENSKTKDEDLANVLNQRTLSGVAKEYFEFVLRKKLEELEIEGKPQFIVGIPASKDSESQAARERYKNLIIKTFKDLNYPEPCFFLEPFAVFQYALNEKLIDLRSGQKNVLVVDIGGGTTNACIIRTNRQGRLNRGGEDHMPHGINTEEIGGETIDKLLLQGAIKQRFVGGALAELSTKSAKEELSKLLNDRGDWLTLNDTKQFSKPIYIDNPSAPDGIETHPLTANLIISTIEQKIWPTVKTLIISCIEDTKASLGTRFPLDYAILSGGTSQANIFKSLFKKDLNKDHFEFTKLISLPDFKTAVARGLVIEASANSRLYEIKPAKIGPYIQNDIQLKVGHSQNLYVPENLKSKTDSTSGNTNPSKLKEGVLIEAPVSFGSLLGDEKEWSFKLKQTPQKRLWVSVFQSEEDIDATNLNCEGNKQSVLLKSETGKNFSPNCTIRVIPRPEGLADLFLSAKEVGKRSPINYPLKPIDLHSLKEIEGDVFCGLDFGTDSTCGATIDATSAVKRSIIPEKYWINNPVRERCLETEELLEGLFSNAGDKRKYLDRYNEETRQDYVYHSNAVEGGNVNRGRTKEIINEKSDQSLFLDAQGVRDHLKGTYIVQPDLKVVAVTHLVKDEIPTVNLIDAYTNLFDLAKNGDERPITIHWFKELHQIVMRGEDKINPGDFRMSRAEIGGSAFVPPDGPQVIPEMERLCEFLNTSDFQKKPAIFKAALAHTWFVSIHPFGDGNGRISRLLANYFLWKDGMPGVLLKVENRDIYYDALEEANTPEVEDDFRGRLDELVILFCDLVEEAVYTIDHLVSGDQVEDQQEDEIVISDSPRKNSRLERLMSRVGDGKYSIDVETQYENWSLFFNGIKSTFVSDAGRLSQIMDKELGTNIDTVEYPVIDYETFLAIKKHREFSRTWLLKADVNFPEDNERVILFFGPSNKNISAADLDDRFKNAVSLHISKFHPATAEYQRSSSKPEWCELLEISHNGSSGSLVIWDTNNDKYSLIHEGQTEFNEWPAMILEPLFSQRERK